MLEKKIAPTGDFVANEKSQKDVSKKKDNKKDKKPNIFKRIGMKLKDIFSELKKVSWPKFGKVVKQTGVVLVVVLIFLVVIFGFDFGLQALLKLVSPNAAG